MAHGDAFELPGAFGDAPAVSGGGFFGDINFGNLAAGAQGIGSLIQGFAGLQQAKTAREQNRLSELFGRANFDASAKSFNERLETRARSRRNRPSFDAGGKSVADVLAQFGVGSLEGGPGSTVGPAAPAPLAQPRSVQGSVGASPTAGFPDPRRRPLGI